MSGYTMTQGELLYAWDGAGTASVPATTPGASICVGAPAIVVPGGFFSNVGSYRTSSLKLVIKGLYICTATIPTWQIIIGSNTSDTWQSTSPWVSMTAFTPASANTGAWFRIDLDFACRTLPLNTSTSTPTLATVSGHGLFTVYGTATASETTPLTYSMPTASSTYSPSQTIDTTLQQYLFPSLVLGAATAGNTLTAESIKLYGEN